MFPCYSLNIGLVKQVGPPSHPIHKESPSKVCTVTPLFSRAFLVWGKPEIITQTPGRMVSIFIFRPSLEINSFSGASIKL